MEHESIGLQRIERLRSALRAVTTQLSDTMHAPVALGAVESAEMDAIGREVTKLGLETQLWARDAQTGRVKAPTATANAHD